MSVLPAIDSLPVETALPALTVIRRPPSGYSPSGMPAAAIASVTSRIPSGALGAVEKAHRYRVDVHAVADQLAADLR